MRRNRMIGRKIRGIWGSGTRLVAMAEGLLPRLATDDFAIESLPFKSEARGWTPT